MGEPISGLANMGATVPEGVDNLAVVDTSDTTQAPTGTTKRWEWLDFLRELFATRFGADAGANDTYVVTLVPAPAAYVTGEHYRFKANTANTGACTVNFNSLGAKAIKKAAGGITTDLADNDIRAGQWVDVVYDGTNMQMQSLLGNVSSGGAPGGSAGGDLTGTYPNPTLADDVVDSAALAPADVNAQTGTTYTLQASDNGKVVTCSNGSAITVTVPSGLGAGFNCLVVQLGAGQVTFSPSSTTVNNRQSHTKIAGQYGVTSLVAYAADTFALGGDTAS